MFAGAIFTHRTAAVATLVTCRRSGFDSLSRQTYFVKTGSDCSTAKRSATGLSVTEIQKVVVNPTDSFFDEKTKVKYSISQEFIPTQGNQIFLRSHS